MYVNYFQLNLFFVLQLIEVKFDLAYLCSNISRINLCCYFFIKNYDYLLDLQETRGCLSPYISIRIAIAKCKREL